jgi:hypothetical protein
MNPIGESTNNHSTGKSGPQTFSFEPAKRRGELFPVGPMRPARQLRIPAVTLPVRVMLRGDRETLRALRAAEMAMWDTSRPTTAAETQTVRAPERIQRLPTPANSGATAEAWLFLVVAVGATAALWFGLGDISRLIAGWTKFMHGVENLIL